MPDVKKKRVKWVNVHEFPLKDPRTGELFKPGEEVKGVNKSVLESWARRGVVEKAK